LQEKCFGSLNSDRRWKVELTESVLPDPHFVKSARMLSKLSEHRNYL
jgi:hypothetical protein